jgi:hypothetical protein
MKTVYRIVSKHPAFGTLYLGRTGPVKAKASAIKFFSRESIEQRIAFWRGLIEKDDLDPKFFGGMEVQETLE